MPEFMPQFPQFAQNYAGLPYGAQVPLNNHLNAMTAPGATNAQLFRAQNLMGGVSPLQGDLFGLPRAGAVARGAIQDGMRGAAINAMTPPPPAMPAAAMPGQGVLPLEQQAARSRLANAASRFSALTPAVAGRGAMAGLRFLGSAPVAVGMTAASIGQWGGEKLAEMLPDSFYDRLAGAQALGIPQPPAPQMAQQPPMLAPQMAQQRPMPAAPQMAQQRPMPAAPQYAPVVPMDDSAMDYAAAQPVAPQSGRFDNDTYRRAYAALGLAPQ